MSELAEYEIRLAYSRLFNDNGKPGDARIVLEDLMNYVGWQTFASIKEFKGSADSWNVVCHEANGRRAVFHRVYRFAAQSESTLLEMQRRLHLAARN
jgi:hypothetical protein